MRDHPTSIRIPVEVRDWLKDRAQANCRTLSGEILALLNTLKQADQKQEAA